MEPNTKFVYVFVLFIVIFKNKQNTDLLIKLSKGRYFSYLHEVTNGAILLEESPELQE